MDGSRGYGAEMAAGLPPADAGVRASDGRMTRGQSWDAEWERIFRSREWGRYPAEHVVRFVARRFYAAPDRSKVRLLDLGCGAGGASTWYFAREGFDVSAIDGSETAVAKTRRRLGAEGFFADVRTGDVIHLPW